MSHNLSLVLTLALTHTTYFHNPCCQDLSLLSFFLSLFNQLLRLTQLSKPKPYSAFNIRRKKNKDIAPTSRAQEIAMFQYEERDEENMSLDGNYAAEVDNFEFNISEAPESIRSDSEPASEPEEPFSNNGSLTYHRDFSVNALLIRMGRRDLIATPVPWDIAMDPAKRTDLERIERLKRMDRNEIVCIPEEVVRFG
ncbi:hypothetical protein L873DRAFT_653934 [Choiromyces venosus 120613-1]|uniref:Uncharacterized protein n=1 Tax=Choiromyces venosus 120613-1 TaxID=1336337 RepID=A0A3N4JT89_9PEZI|nr:hypothetical protein L873DRAFT_653934 [Choiromyces venosus 120613-1]